MHCSSKVANGTVDGRLKESPLVTAIITARFEEFRKLRHRSYRLGNYEDKKAV